MLLLLVQLFQHFGNNFLLIIFEMSALLLIFGHILDVTYSEYSYGEYTIFKSREKSQKNPVSPLVGLEPAVLQFQHNALPTDLQRPVAQHDRDYVYIDHFHNVKYIIYSFVCILISLVGLVMKLRFFF